MKSPTRRVSSGAVLQFAITSTAWQMAQRPSHSGLETGVDTSNIPRRFHSESHSGSHRWSLLSLLPDKSCHEPQHVIAYLTRRWGTNIMLLSI